MGITQDPISSSPPPPASSSQSGEPNPIGVPKGYTTPRRQHQREEMGDIRFRRDPQSYTSQIPPSYFDGDEYIPANWPADQIFQLQQALGRVGLLTGTFTPHTWDQSTRNAYKELLALANAQGIDANRALGELLRTSSAEKGGQYKVDEFGNIVPVGQEQGPPPLVTRTTDPAQLRTTFRKAVIETLGEGWSQEEINKMVAAYNQVEIQRQTQAYNMDINGTAGNVQEIPSPEAFIEEQITKKDPVGVQTNDALDFTQDFMQIANSPAWGVG